MASCIHAHTEACIFSNWCQDTQVLPTPPSVAVLGVIAAFVTKSATEVKPAASCPSLSATLDSDFMLISCIIMHTSLLHHHSQVFLSLILLTFLKCSQCTGPRARPNARHLHNAQKRGWASPPSSWPRSQSPGELLTKWIENCKMDRNVKMQSATKRLMRKWTVPSCSNEDSEVCNTGRLQGGLLKAYACRTTSYPKLWRVCVKAAKGCDTMIIYHVRDCASSFHHTLGLMVTVTVTSSCGATPFASGITWAAPNDAFSTKPVGDQFPVAWHEYAEDTCKIPWHVTNQILSGMGPWIENDFPEETKWNAWKEIVVASCDVLHKRWHSWFNPSSQSSDILCLFGCGMMWQ